MVPFPKKLYLISGLIPPHLVHADSVLVLCCEIHVLPGMTSDFLRMNTALQFWSPSASGKGEAFGHAVGPEKGQIFDPDLIEHSRQDMQISPTGDCPQGGKIRGHGSPTNFHDSCGRNWVRCDWWSGVYFARLPLQKVPESLESRSDRIDRQAGNNSSHHGRNIRCSKCPFPPAHSQTDFRLLFAMPLVCDLSCQGTDRQAPVSHES